MDENLEGLIQSVVYSNDETGWAVLRVACADGSLHTAVGHIPAPAPGETIHAKGQWSQHPAHGEQFSVRSAERLLPAGSDAILEYLASGIVQGVGRATARLLVETFGDRTLDVLEREPERLSTVRGITPKRAQSIGALYAKQTTLRRLMETLVRHELTPSYALELTKRYGAGAADRLREDPYILLYEPFDAPFEQADKLAAALGVEDGDERRLKAGLLYELIFNLDQGHVYLPREKLIPAAAGLLGQGEDELEEALQDLFCDNKVVACDDGAVYLTRLYNAESQVAAFVRERSGRSHPLPRDLDTLLGRIEEELGIEYAETQREAITRAAGSGLLVLTGGPGTGKTTILRGLLRLFDWMGLKALLAAPTGRAAKRMSELCDRDASTIHRLLEFGYDPSLGILRFLRDEENPLQADVVVLDEVSMVDILLMDSISRAVSDDARLILVGDPDQLPAVGPGSVLEDILETAPSVRLTEIFRQAAESRIITGAHSVNRGETPSLKNDHQRDLFFLRRRDMISAVGTIQELCAERLPGNLGIEPSQIQVLTPTRRGPCGTVSLNKALQEALNPEAPHKLEKRFGEFLYREGDRVMQIRNNYDLAWRQEANAGMGVFNGEIGTVAEIDLKASLVTVNFDDRIVEYPFDSLGELEPAYALTVHKAQGSEYRAVVLAVMPGPQKLMTRRVLYTAITRARDYLIIVGQDEIIEAMVRNDKRLRRYTGLKKMLQC
ncbi:MAG: ATP-dependent RecD-like DNA helicase [Oscillospiraceae bacterium]|jgi:exodeoxyribonuclease V alpha subunit|nr:ATP-dependent RecD-like DNA helicase [Oscillospiraceae bacterium]